MPCHDPLPDPITATVCVCTMRRPESLRRLLGSLSAQVSEADSPLPPFEVVVVDNDADGSAAGIVEEFSTDLSLRYAIEPQRGLATARNACVRRARGEFLAFVDDDEIVVPTWLSALHRSISESAADAVFGTVAIEFDGPVRESVRLCRFFQDRVAIAGAVVPWYFTKTGNAYVRRSSLPCQEEPFRARFDRTGGEDIDLFQRMAAAGALFVAADAAARATEHRAGERATVSWALRRSLRNGGNLADLQWQGYGLGKRWLLAARGVVATPWHALRGLLHLRRSRLYAFERCLDIAENVGRFLSLCGYRYPEYDMGRDGN